MILTKSVNRPQAVPDLFDINLKNNRILLVFCFFKEKMSFY
jgi:hypothetical protein